MCKFDIKPRKKAAFKGRQTYWKAGGLPIPKQRNDDDRIGNDDQLGWEGGMGEKKASKNISKMTRAWHMAKAKRDYDEVDTTQKDIHGLY